MQNQTLSRPDITYAVSQFNLQRSYEASYYSFQDDFRYMVGTHDKEIIVPSFIGDLFLKCNVDTNFTDLLKIDCQEDPTSSKSYTSFITSLGQCRPNFEIISTNWSVSIHSWSWMFSTKCSTLCLHQALHWSFQKIPHQLSHAQVHHHILLVQSSMYLQVSSLSFIMDALCLKTTMVS